MKEHAPSPEVSTAATEGPLFHAALFALSGPRTAAPTTYLPPEMALQLSSLGKTAT